MSSETTAESASPQPIETTPAQPIEAQQIITPENLKNIVASAVESALNAYRKETEASQHIETATKIAESVSASQAKLVTPSTAPTLREQKLKHVQDILDDYEDKKAIDSSGRPWYKKDSDESLYKIKIIMMKKIGMTAEQIAEMLESE